ncbi:hypothetical protein TWF703_007177 [Orbilia oligospora]|uniref:Uncharacterized protein n=1 Tax=Orbilia oligospora TaxID=2813651 RepID=A0A7C8NWZ6_ORBOL|nr:hypothetical protein TWF703_007177 [Orbilia oligospora]
MNTVKSFWVGWGSLIVGGGAAYYFAKQSIDADRREKHMQRIMLKKRRQRRTRKFRAFNSHTKRKPSRSSRSPVIGITRTGTDKTYARQRRRKSDIEK